MTPSSAKKKLLFFIGTRPEAIKMCPLVLEAKKEPSFDVEVCLTGQHREMLHSAIDLFGVKPDYDLDVMKPNQTLTYLTSELISKESEIVQTSQPDLVLVHGDTTTAFCGSVAGFYCDKPVAHVEAGLRTHNLQSPFPEEFNRRVVDLVSSLLFAPTELSAHNLLNEGASGKIFITGNTAIDALKYTISKTFADENLQWAEGHRLILMTCHRRENLLTTMNEIFEAINDVTNAFPDVRVIYPVHPNPKVREIAHQYFDNNPKVRLIDPLDVVSFHNYMERAYLIATDSGGIQEEAPSLGKPVVVLRNETERPEGVEAGTLVIAGTKREGVFSTISKLLTDSSAYQKMAESKNPYGDGKASSRIVCHIKEFFL